jgi:pimeloyl-ACP methyl ester carboxylesterase
MARIGPRVVTAVEELAGIRLADLELAAIGRALDVPVLAVHDKDDPLVPLPDATHAVAAMRDGGLVVTSGLGHFRILRERAIVREVTAFVEHGASAPAGASATEVLGTAA